jgi:hypothetical protein
MMKEQLKVKGKLEIFEENIKVLEKDNLIVNVGSAFISSRLKDNTDNFLDYIAVGTDDTSVTLLDTTLGNEIERKQANSKTSTTSQFVIQSSFSISEALGNWKEAGIFNESTGGIMFDRVVFNYIKGEVNTTVRFTITFTIN